jgi:hypothetical protein
MEAIIYNKESGDGFIFGRLELKSEVYRNTSSFLHKSRLTRWTIPSFITEGAIKKLHRFDISLFWRPFAIHIAKPFVSDEMQRS